MQLHHLFLKEELTPVDVTPTVIIPGLFGSSINWRGFGKQLSLHCPVYLIDQRNHGRSPHCDTHSYADMVSDLLTFLDQQGLDKVVLCGHSMGGKVAMLFALLHPERVEKLLVLDIAPITYTHTHAPFLKALQEIDLSSLASRSEADRMVAKAIPETSTRLFLLQSLVSSDGEFSWRLNLDVLHDFMPQIIGFPDSLVENETSAAPSLFLYGDESDYVPEQSHSLIRRYFTDAHIAPIEQAGHWLHVQQPAKVLEAIVQFIK